MSFVRKKSSKISRPQKAALKMFMKKHPRLLCGKFDRNFRHEDARNLWKSFTNHVHTLPGARKTWIQWRKAWQDVRRTAFQHDKSYQKIIREVHASLKIEPPDDLIAMDPVDTSNEDHQSSQSHHDFHFASVNSGDEPDELDELDEPIEHYEPDEYTEIPSRYAENVNPIVKLAEDLMKSFKENMKAEQEYRETHLKLIREQTDAIKSIAESLEKLKK